MDKKKKSGRKIKKFGFVQVAICVLACIAFLILVFLNFREMFQVSMDNVYRNCENNYLSVSSELSRYLLTADDTISTICTEIEKMQEEGMTNDQIKGYLEWESSKIDKTLIGNSTGIYGFINDEYLDGTGWKPGEDFVASERPWYIDALKMEGNVAHVSPYVDLKTGGVVITISKLLSDGYSVVALDLKTTRLQEIVNEITSMEGYSEDGVNDSHYGSSALYLLDQEGNVVIHSNASEQMKNYLTDSDAETKYVVGKVIHDDKTGFVAGTGSSETVYMVGELNDEWYLFSKLAFDEVFSHTLRILWISMLVGAIGSIGIIFIVISMAVRRYRAESLNQKVNSIAGIYLTMQQIYLKDNTFDTISCESKPLKAFLRGKNRQAKEAIIEAFENFTDDRSKENMAEFARLDTLTERMGEDSVVSAEFMDSRGLWCRARFIETERDENGGVSNVLLVVENIDREKRDREHLRYLSETDRMTGINNRGSGESKIRDYMAEGKHGMFILLDVDKFKDINDRFGHGVGDKALIGLANAMKATFRERDVIMRLGGDEFAAYVPTICDEEAAEPVMKRFFANVDKIDVEELIYRPVKVSVGAAFYKEGDNFLFEELYQRADQGTYNSKKHKGNYVTYYQEAKE